MRSRLARAAGVVFVATTWMLSGCQSDGGNGNISPMQHPMLENVPIPRGFRIVDSRSRSGAAAGGQRWARCTFTGSLERGATVKFYEDNMPTAKWQERERRFENGVFELRYDNPIGETCVVFVRNGFLSTEIEVDLKHRTDGGRAISPPP